MFVFENNAFHSVHREEDLNRLLRQLQWSHSAWSNSVVMFNTGLWPLKYCPDPVECVQHALPRIFELFRRALEQQHGVKMVWRTTHWNYRHYSANGHEDNDKFNAARDRMNVFSKSMAEEYGWSVIDDYSQSFNRKDQVFDGIHYNGNSSVMDFTVQSLKRIVCSD